MRIAKIPAEIVEDTGIVTAKIDEQKTGATRAKIFDLVKKL